MTVPFVPVENLPVEKPSPLLNRGELIAIRGSVVDVYNRPISGSVYILVHQHLLPLDVNFRRQQAQFLWLGTCLPRLVGNAAKTLHLLIGEHLFVSLFRACAESLASENTSRLAAMQRADKNIDEELFDVIAGFEVLKI